MGRKRTPGLVWRQGLWHIDKRIGGQRVCQSTGTAKQEEAELFLARLIEETRQEDEKQYVIDCVQEFYIGQKKRRIEENVVHSRG